MTSDEAPKSSYELAMARLRQKDKEAGLGTAGLAVITLRSAAQVTKRLYDQERLD